MSADVEPDTWITRAASFGLVLSVIEVSNYREAAEGANGVRYGLSSASCTNRQSEKTVNWHTPVWRHGDGSVAEW